MRCGYSVEKYKRFRSFFGYLKYKSHADFLRELFPRGERSDAPIMEALEVQTGSRDATTGEIMSPQLQALDLRGRIFPLRSFTAHQERPP